MLKRVRLYMEIERQGVAARLFDGEEQLLDPAALVARSEGDDTDEPVQMELYCEGRLRWNEDELSLTYEEPQEMGMDRTQTQISFRFSQPNLITMLRTGSVKTALVFEEGKRHTSIYQTPIMPFEVCVHTLTVDNRLMQDATLGGSLALDYVVEIRGAQAERCRLQLQLKE